MRVRRLEDCEVHWDPFRRRREQARGAVVQEEAELFLVGVLEQMVDAVGVEQRRPALDPVDLVTFREQQLSEIRAVLTGNTGDERAPGHAGC